MQNIGQKMNIKDIIKYNSPADEKLHVVVVVSNPCMYKTRHRLASEFMERMAHDEDAVVYLVELVYQNQPFVLSQAENPRHLRLRAQYPLWHKESMINVAVERLLPKTWKIFAWIDADIEFESPSWVQDTLRVLSVYDVVQLFSHALDMDKDGGTMNTFASFGHQHVMGYPFSLGGRDQWHPGYAWAMTRHAYMSIGGLYDLAILGSGDMVMALSFIGRAGEKIHDKMSLGYRHSVLYFQESAQKLRLGYVPGVIRHYYHGTKANRRYVDRWQILIKYNYDPRVHVRYDEQGLLVSTEKMPVTMLKDIYAYFLERKEDE